MNKIATICIVVLLGSSFLAWPTRDVAAQNLEPSTPGVYAVAREEYDFGDTAFAPSGFPGPVELRGSVHYPLNWTGGPLPLIVFLHGRHSVCFQGESNGSFVWPCPASQQPTPSYKGYDYISKVLASNGYVVVSISANGINAVDNNSIDLGAQARAELIQKHLDLWNTFNTTGGAPFGTKFVGKINMQRIGTMGHSRGGEGVVRNFQLNQSLGSPYGIKAVFALAPVDFSRFVINNVPLAVLLPYCDGDVSDLQGVHFYDDARYNVPGDLAPKHTVLVLGANHNFYNTIWTPSIFPGGSDDDWRGETRNSDPFCGTVAGNGRLSEALERATGLAYIAAFLRVYVGGERQFLPLLTAAAPPPPSTAGSRIFVSFHAPDNPLSRRDVNRWLNANQLTTNTLGGAVTPTALSMYDVCGGAFPLPTPCLPLDPANRQPHTVKSFLSTAPGITQLRMSWESVSGKLVHGIPPGQGNVSGFQVLQFRASVNFADPRNATAMAQNFRVVLRDGGGGSASVRASDLSPALFFPPGAVDVVPKVVLNTVRLPLSAFVGVNLTNITSVEFDFDQKPSGALLVTDIAFASAANITLPGGLFDNCLKDDSSGAELAFNTSTGAYAFCCPGSAPIGGFGQITVKGNILTLQQGPGEGDRRVVVQIDRGVNRGTASLQSPPGRTLCSITDRNTSNSSCSCSN